MISSTSIIGWWNSSSFLFIGSAFFSSSASGVFFRHLSRSGSLSSDSAGQLEIPSGNASSTTKAHSLADVVVTP